MDASDSPIEDAEDGPARELGATNRNHRSDLIDQSDQRPSKGASLDERPPSATPGATPHRKSWRLNTALHWGLRTAASPFRGLRDLLLLALARFARQLPSGLDWRLKSLFFFLTRPLLRGTRQLREFDEVVAWRARPLAVAHSETTADVLAKARLEPGNEALGDVVVFGVIDWHFRVQRPQHLATELARSGRRVFYVAPGFVPGDHAGFQLDRMSEELPIWELRLAAPSGVRVYDGAVHGAALEQLAAGLRELLGAVALRHVIGIIDHPGWWPLARLLPRSVLLYDCMDNHHGFAEAGPTLAADEAATIAGVDALVVSSVWLREAFKEQRPELRMVRNGCDPEHFKPSAPSGDGARMVIGYFGAMAQWFDADLVRQVAEAFPQHELLLVGADSAGVLESLQNCENIRALGERPYAELPQHVQRMDICLIPFLINDLTRATNPVKAYEALAAGKPVVATPMPELVDEDFGGHVRIAPRGPEFVATVAAALEDARDSEQMAARREVAIRHDWAHRAEQLLEAIEAAPRPTASVVIVTWNGVELSRRCLASVLEDPAAPELEVIVVDNASTDETSTWLDELASEARVRVIRNADNRGFAAACNQGLAAARGDLLVILNNDIVVTPGWLRTMHRHFREQPELGLLGPVTNNIGNEARIVTGYERDLEAMQEEQRAYTASHAGRSFELAVLAFFCVAIPRDVYETVGDLDENFGMGFFEDDDYAQRVRQIGRRVLCAEDVFVHHELSASFGKIDQGARRELFERNRAYYESKWGAWEPHSYRPPSD
ncbi:MAG: group 2 family glycosyltransferase [Planctomycetota bacterium]|nr:MAG: group 2 family glycosyltransferase [Planctomycetota bacterium]